MSTPPPKSPPPPSGTLVRELAIRAAFERNTEHLKSLSTMATEALKASLLINGGAIVALLAFTGGSPSAARSEAARQMSGALLFYGFGVFCAAVALALSYLTQLNLFNERVGAEQVMYKLENRTMTPELEVAFERMRADPVHNKYLKAALISGMFSLFFFLVGSFLAFLVLQAR